MHTKLHKNLFIFTCSLHWNIKSSREVCDKPVLWWKTLIYWMDICCRCTLKLPLWGNSNVYQQPMLLKLRKPIMKYTLNKYHVDWFSSFKHLKLPISIKIPVTICDQPWDFGSKWGTWSKLRYRYFLIPICLWSIHVKFQFDILSGFWEKGNSS